MDPSADWQQELGASHAELPQWIVLAPTSPEEPLLPPAALAEDAVPLATLDPAEPASVADEAPAAEDPAAEDPAADEPPTTVGDDDVLPATEDEPLAPPPGLTVEPLPHDAAITIAAHRNPTATRRWTFMGT